VDPFIQTEDGIYWLAVDMGTQPLIGWKESGSSQFNDDGVYWDLSQGWKELRDPFYGSSVDLAFVVNCEPRDPEPMGTAFTYQGRLFDTDRPANGEYDFQFELYDCPYPCAGGQQGGTITIENVTVADGYFTVQLDFGSSIFTGDARWLQAGARAGQMSDPNQYTTLSPLQELTPTPYAIYAKTAESVVSGISGSGTANYIAKFVNANTLGDSVIYESPAGNVGIGTTNAGAKLTVNGGILRSGSTMSGTSADSHINLGVSSVTGEYAATVGGGSGNQATDIYATVGGGWGNTASAHVATVGGGRGNDANGHSATVGGGYYNTASANDVTVGGGYHNIASARYATVPGGYFNTAAGEFSFAAGYRAKANHRGAFVWADKSTIGDLASARSDQFLIRAAGGTLIYSNPFHTAGVELLPGASAWSSVSDVALKRNIRPVDGKEILSKLAEIPISRWSYKAQNPNIEHIGPMAQDFYGAFGLDEDDRHISTIDLDGVALAAIQGLYELVQEKDAEITALKTRLTGLEALVKQLAQQQEGGQE
jgi:hypothetical protein